MSSTHVIRSKDFDTQVQVFGVPTGSTVGISLKLSGDEYLTVTGIGTAWIEELASRLQITLSAWRLSALDKPADCTYHGVDHTQAQEIIAAELSSDQPDAEEERTARRVPVDTHAERVKRAKRHGWNHAFNQRQGFTCLERENNKGLRFFIAIPW